jgi:tetratricopeptide (TPR) repeat protein
MREFKGELMRIRSAAACLALIAGCGLALAGCGQFNQIRGMKAYKDGNKLYASSDWRGAADKYEEAIALDPENKLSTCTVGPGCVYFYLANSYDNLFRPAKRGDAANDALLDKAIANYKLASEKITQDEKMRTLSLEYLVASYGPEKLNDPTSAEPVVKRMIELNPNEPTNYFALAKIYEDSGEYELAEQMFLKGRDAKPNDPTVYTVLAGYYNRQGDFAKTIATLNERIKIEPNNPEAHYTVAQFYWDKAFRDFRLSDKEKMQYVMDGLAAIDKAIAIRADYMEAITYKGLLFRLQANLEKDPKKQQQLLKDASVLADRANELRKKAAGTN